MGLNHQLSEVAAVTVSQSLDAVQHPAVFPENMFGASASPWLDRVPAVEKFFQRHLPKAWHGPPQGLGQLACRALAVGSQPGVLSIDQLVLHLGIGDDEGNPGAAQGQAFIGKGLAVKEEDVIAFSEKRRELNHDPTRYTDCLLYTKDAADDMQ